MKYYLRRSLRGYKRDCESSLFFIKGVLGVKEMNPYVAQIDKFVSSINKLSTVFLGLEEKKDTFSEERVMEMCHEICERTCGNCERRHVCLVRDLRKIHTLAWEIFRTIEKCGVELNVEMKRKVKDQCGQAAIFLQNAIDVYREEKQKMMWEQKMVQSREGCVVQLDSFAQMIRHATHELNASIFEDEPLERKIRQRFAKLGIRILTTVFFVTEEGRYEIHLTLRTNKGQVVSTKQIPKILSECCDRNMILEGEERPAIGNDYMTVVCNEGPKYYTLTGSAKIGKGCRKISGDSFSMIELPGKKQAVILSDGMGAGEKAYRESTMVIELLEELLEAGFLKETALQMLNTALVIGREETCFSTVDMCVFDLYSGECSITKAGASFSFLKRKSGVESVKSTSLPIGVIQKLEIDEVKQKMADGEYVILVSDGVIDALPVGEQEFLMKMMIEGSQKTNPKEMAEHLLRQVLECSGEVPADDMTILVVGLWSLEK